MYLERTIDVGLGAWKLTPGDRHHILASQSHHRQHVRVATNEALEGTKGAVESANRGLGAAEGSQKVITQ